MKKILIIFLLVPIVFQAQTLEECQQAAEQNYPLIQQYGLIEKITELTVANIDKGWLPQVAASSQITYQSDVTAWPSQMKAMYQQLGIDMHGLKKDQYRIGLDIQQTIYDGGFINNQKAIAYKQGKLMSAQTEVDLYNVRKRVNEMYFTLLLLEEQIVLNRDLQEVLKGNEQKLSSMVKRGTAAESDWANIRAERLNVIQQATTLESQKHSFQTMLSVLCGIEVTKLQKPTESADGIRNEENLRPELKVIDAQLGLTEAQEHALDITLRPKLSVFAQGYYGYPGYNMFENMLHHNLSFNGMIGARLIWDIGALYTRKNDKAKLNAQRSTLNVQRDVFLFNSKLEQVQQKEDVARYRKLMAEDEEIIALRSSVRKAAESKLSHGIIDVNDLVREIKQENAARVQQSIHEIEMLRQIYNYKFAINN